MVKNLEVAIEFQLSCNKIAIVATGIAIVATGIATPVNIKSYTLTNTSIRNNHNKIMYCTAKYKILFLLYKNYNTIIYK